MEQHETRCFQLHLKNNWRFATAIQLLESTHKIQAKETDRKKNGSRKQLRCGWYSVFTIQSIDSMRCTVGKWEFSHTNAFCIPHFSILADSFASNRFFLLFFSFFFVHKPIAHTPFWFRPESLQCIHFFFSESKTRDDMQRKMKIVCNTHIVFKVFSFHF